MRSFIDSYNYSIEVVVISCCLLALQFQVSMASAAELSEDILDQRGQRGTRTHGHAGLGSGAIPKQYGRRPDDRTLDQKIEDSYRAAGCILT